MKKLILTVMTVSSVLVAMACPVCERNQPKILRGITHGGGPESQWDYYIVCSMLTVVVLTLIFTIKWLVRPGESSDAHIKRTILNPTFL